MWVVIARLTQLSDPFSFQLVSGNFEAPALDNIKLVPNQKFTGVSIDSPTLSQKSPPVTEIKMGETIEMTPLKLDLKVLNQKF
jgi:hypothetical protein